jgi:hypothetical protein
VKIWLTEVDKARSLFVDGKAINNHVGNVTTQDVNAWLLRVGIAGYGDIMNIGPQFLCDKLCLFRIKSFGAVLSGSFI